MVNYKLSDASSTTLLYYPLFKDAKCKLGPALEAYVGVTPFQSAQLPGYFDADDEIVLSCIASFYGVSAMVSHRMVQKNPLLSVSMDLCDVYWL